MHPRLQRQLLRAGASADQPPADAAAWQELLERLSAAYVEEDHRLHSQKLEAVGRLAGGVAHDFNNLLSVILSYSAILTEELPEDNAMREDVQQILRAGERAAELVKQLLAFSRRQVTAPEQIDLDAAIASMAAMLGRLLGTHFELELDLVAEDRAGDGEARAFVKADPGQLEQIVVNLVVNARDAMPDGGTIGLATETVEIDEAASARAKHPRLEPGTYVVLAVSDAGCGMDERTREHMFEPFFTTKAPGKGTGLGLSTVFGIVEQMGGHIAVDSEVGAGTLLRIYLPCARAPGASTPDPNVEHGAIAPAAATVLLAEDEEQVRLLACEILRRAGYRVLVAKDGPDAVRLSGEFPHVIDLLVTDLIMPAMSGRELAEHLAGSRPSMKTLLMSGYTEDAVVHRAVLQAGLPFLQKPILPKTLLAKVRDVLAVHSFCDAESGIRPRPAELAEPPTTRNESGSPSG
jgi:signal transduction histidine kinase/CheY-like chemotaxis protein